MFQARPQDTPAQAPTAKLRRHAHHVYSANHCAALPAPLERFRSPAITDGLFSVIGQYDAIVAVAARTQLLNDLGRRIWTKTPGPAENAVLKLCEFRFPARFEQALRQAFMFWFSNRVRLKIQRHFSIAADRLES